MANVFHDDLVDDVDTSMGGTMGLVRTKVVRSQRRSCGTFEFPTKRPSGIPGDVYPATTRPPTYAFTHGHRVAGSQVSGIGQKARMGIGERFDFDRFSWIPNRATRRALVIPHNPSFVCRNLTERFIHCD